MISEEINITMTFTLRALVVFSTNWFLFATSMFHFFELCKQEHCVKNVRIQNFSGLHFPTFVLKTERYGVSLRIQSKCRKIRTRETPNTDTFQTKERNLAKR